MKSRAGVIFGVGLMVVSTVLSTPAASGRVDDKESKSGTQAIHGLQPEKDRKDAAAAALQVTSLVNAVKLYETQYAVLPIGNGGGEKVVTTQAGFIDILTGLDKDQNPKQTVFLEAKPVKKLGGGKLQHSGFIDEGMGSKRLVDPWGNEYAVIMDADDDNQIKVPGGGLPHRTKVVSWSYGKPKNPRDPKSARKNPQSEWITSWSPIQPAKKLGILKGNPELRAKQDLQTFKAGLNIFRMKAATFPSTEQGLEALVKKPAVGRIPKIWNQVLKAEQLDPWGKPYGYRYPGKHNIAGPDIWSFGPDKIDGTEDDIGNW